MDTQGYGTTPCAFALGVLGAAPHSPSPREAFAGAAECCICGGPAHAHGPAWKRASIIPDSFGPVELFARHDSPAACGACAFFAVGKTFKEEIARRELPVKTWVNVAWRSYSHVFSAYGHAVPRRDDWRTFLLAPPEPPFLAVMTTAGAKNLIFRGRVATDRRMFPLLVEETCVWVDPDVFGDVLRDFEEARAAGLTRDELLTGRYRSSTLARVGRAAWELHEAAVGGHRARRLQLLRLAHAVAENTNKEKEPTP